MTKEERLAYMKERFPQLEDSIGEIPLSKRDIRESVEELDSFREHTRDRVSQREGLTSDEL